MLKKFVNSFSCFRANQKTSKTDKKDTAGFSVVRNGAFSQGSLTQRDGRHGSAMSPTWVNNPAFSITSRAFSNLSDLAQRSGSAVRNFCKPDLEPTQSPPSSINVNMAVPNNAPTSSTSSTSASISSTATTSSTPGTTPKKLKPKSKTESKTESASVLWKFFAKLFSLTKAKTKAKTEKKAKAEITKLQNLLQAAKNEGQLLTADEISYILDFQHTGIIVSAIECMGGEMPANFITEILSQNNPEEHIAVLKHYKLERSESSNTRLDDEDLDRILSHPGNPTVDLEILKAFAPDDLHDIVFSDGVPTDDSDQASISDSSSQSLNPKFLKKILSHDPDSAVYIEILDRCGQDLKPKALNKMIEQSKNFADFTFLKKALKYAKSYDQNNQIKLHQTALNLFDAAGTNMPSEISEYYLTHHEPKIILMFLDKYLSILGPNLQAEFASHDNLEVVSGLLNLYKKKKMNIRRAVISNFIKNKNEDIVKDLIHYAFASLKNSTEKKPVFTPEQQKLLAQKSEDIALSFLNGMLRHQQKIDRIAQADLAETHSESDIIPFILTAPKRLDFKKDLEADLKEDLGGLGEDLSSKAIKVLSKNTNRLIMERISEIKKAKFKAKAPVLVKT